MRHSGRCEVSTMASTPRQHTRMWGVEHRRALRARLAALTRDFFDLPALEHGRRALELCDESTRAEDRRGPLAAGFDRRIGEIELGLGARDRDVEHPPLFFQLLGAAQRSS